MSHWITLQPDLGIDYQSSHDTDQSDLPSTKWQSDEMFEDIRAIAELEPSGIVHIAVFIFHKLYNFYLSAAFSY